MTCVFCKIIAGQLPAVKVFEGERSLAFMDINPRSDGHCLIIPKTHAPTLFDIREEDLVAVMNTARRVAMAIKSSLVPDGMLVYQLNGRVAMQLVDHFHVHLVPRWKNDGVDLSHGFQPGNMEKIRAIAEKIIEALSGEGSPLKVHP
jgi:histidine triad (HIT) family protein